MVDNSKNIDILDDTATVKQKYAPTRTSRNDFIPDMALTGASAPYDIDWLTTFNEAISLSRRTPAISLAASRARKVLETIAYKLNNRGAISESRYLEVINYCSYAPDEEIVKYLSRGMDYFADEISRQKENRNAKLKKIDTWLNETSQSILSEDNFLINNTSEKSDFIINLFSSSAENSLPENEKKSLNIILVDAAKTLTELSDTSVEYKLQFIIELSKLAGIREKELIRLADILKVYSRGKDLSHVPEVMILKLNYSDKVLEHLTNKYPISDVDTFTNALQLNVEEKSEAGRSYVEAALNTAKTEVILQQLHDLSAGALYQVGTVDQDMVFRMLVRFSTL